MVCWFFFVLAFFFRKRAKVTGEETRDRHALAGMLIEGVGFALVWSFRRSSVSLFPWESPLADIVTGTVAVVLAFASVWVVITAIKSLDKQWALAARLVEDHQLITTGPYSRMRHPIYSAMFGLLIATGLVLSTWWALLAGGLIFYVGTIIRVRVEEKLLHQHFGQTFTDYRLRVPAFFPKLV